jgi:uncharacterized membrane protein YraQ (UPF0718 family)
MLTESLRQIAFVATGIILEAGFWIVLSLLAAGLIHEFLDHDRFRAALRHSGRSSLFGALGLGAVLPMCSCGVIPLAVSLYLNGTRLAAVMTFAAATPVINPAAVVLAYALLGPQLTIAYVVFGLTVPVLVGVMTERWGQTRLTPVAAELHSCCSTSSCSTGTAADTRNGAALRSAIVTRGWRAIRWGFGELGPTLGLYIGIGALLAGVVAIVVPPDWIATHLGGAAPFSSLLLVALFGASIYVCAVAHIPLVAALLASGAGPGAAIVFLVTGAASNLPEFVALQRVLGTRTVLVYVFGLIGSSLLAGWAVNLWLAPGFDPVLDPIQRMEWLELGSRITPVIPATISVASAAGVFVLIAWGFARWVVRRLPYFKSVGSLR